MNIDETIPPPKKPPPPPPLMVALLVGIFVAVLYIAALETMKFQQEKQELQQSNQLNQNR
jgi:hypothetical protein